MTKRVRAFLLGLGGLLVVAVVWELYKILGPEDGVVVGGRAILPRTSDRAMPHIWEMVSRLFEPAVGQSGPPLWQNVAEACLFTLRIAAVGWVIGVVVGLALAL